MKPSFLPLIALLFTACSCLAQDSAKEKDYDLTFTKVTVEAHYPGGYPGWNRYLTQNLRYPGGAVSDGVQGTVVVQFAVNKDSTISEIQVISGPTKGGLREEAIRVITQSGKWIPARHAGTQVKSIIKESIEFVMTKEQGHSAEAVTMPDSVRALTDYYFKVEKLEQYQREKSKLESSMRAGNVLLAVHVIPQSFFKEDSGKNVIVAFINEEWKTRPKIAYIVRFDSAHNVLSVNKYHSMTPEEKSLALAAPKKHNE